ncbi:7-carboxy-7-deazaguanine synthase QueE [Bacillus cytotoxicus]|uniref:7-carboxy-7-deazaguanine synthase n=1 Tax=Bacillus cytotoxicus (strain DSM 22905 / CIP 110041 / 391-98 / NVH 391-98) TaxID=315749 RepID=A7GMN4_BACCN|nr:MULTISPECIES: 7-carboxy-7-deazaguanine synthase QueE [Bacillus cereus group]ABS21392.1 Radical SAM domain protein [Bacillus cytotoxicus NVH 391-98]AWC28038.1 7-carboxy-7-deazaguanine synthase QueE [Bacillus cytotoxicus]AWC40580.1 7-carboxy-7-deazaguanine synthase QueE [Bacillus cytotoxicus]AWC44103.1 7-carboxy-7-deazaguanine synthase QueE [Bacillus cytotoxicus]AWC48511.1 7-carboxy-7-deazaguanine synthase QueE [Bacillus cytotoxicus]
MSKIPVLEIFGPTIQGEGMVVGQKTMFIRTAGCDYSCAWCDSAFTWDGSAKDQIRQMTPEEIWKELIEIGGENFSHVTISGGNPVLLKHMKELLERLKENNIRTAIETQGSKWQEWLLDIDEITISPKPPSSKMKTNFTMLDLVVERLVDKNMSLKVVIFDDDDFEYAKNVHERYPHVPFFLQVGNDDTKTAEDAVLIPKLLQKYEWLIEKAVHSKEMNDVKVLPQLHALVWGNKRGV